MEKIGTFQEAHNKVLTDIQRTLETIHQLSLKPCTTAEAGIRILERLRKETYEDLNPDTT